MIEAEYKARLKNLLYSLGLDGATSETVIENKAQDCEARSISCGVSVGSVFDDDLTERGQAD